MKKIALAVVALGGVASLAHAQSSVTLYGIVDEGLSYTTNAGGNSAWQLTGGIAQGSRWGLKGTEELGGGLRTIFQLENGFQPSNGTLGQGGRMFGRQAYVGIGSDTSGTVTLGRQYDSVVDYLGPLTANGSWGGTYFSHPLDNDNTNNSFRINNAVKYTSANYAGLTFGGLYGFSNDSGFANNRAWSVGLRYGNGPLTAGAAFLQVNNGGFTTAGAVAGTSTTSTGDARFVASRQRVAGAGVNYVFGPAAAGVVYTYTNINGIGWNGGSGLIALPSSAHYNNIEVNAKYTATPSVVLGAMYDYTKVNGQVLGYGFGGHWNVFGLMADYLLSKRTDVYAQAVYVRASQDAGAQVYGSAGTSDSHAQTVARVGMRHKF